MIFEPVKAYKESMTQGKFSIKILMLICLALLISSCGTGAVVFIKKQLGFKVPVQESGEKLTDMKAFLDSEIPELASAKTHLEKARILRNFVHSHSQIGVSPYNLPPDLQTLQNWKKGEIKLVCSGMTSFYGSMLSALDIPFRLVDTFLENDPDPKFDGHSFLEVETEAGWVIQDPTFNIEWSQDGRLLNTRQLRSLIKEKGLPQEKLAVTNGYSVHPKRSLGAYHHKMDQLLNFYEIRDYSFYDKAGPGITLVSLYPHDSSRKYDRLKDRRIPAPENFAGFATHKMATPQDVNSKQAKKITASEGGLKVETNEVCYDMQFNLKLPLNKASTHCSLSIPMKILSGGINLGFVANNSVLGSLKHWETQFKNCEGPCPSFIELKSEKPFKELEITFLNWNENRDKTSRWEIGSIDYLCN